MPVEKCYPSGKNTPLMIAGYALLGLGLIVAGALLLRLSKAWR